MKKQSLLYSLALTGLAVEAYLQYNESKKRKQFLHRIVDQTKHDCLLTNSHYIGSWRIRPDTSSDHAQFHFGFNYQDATGNLEVQEFWADVTNGKIIKRRLIQP
ncbi:hypothetical protein [Lentilactobacillus kisonensis]|uniref:PepSY domain-containing protein n=2 Tax=Lentilactobacillus kisonensis TaxID=481722 RepID=H1LGL4_9LACO|nr:hypothetical protein [Lentilactobacillus kisonensis]EHO50948.1 hypothetical protein HMPREF9104_01742 [Lentilactobacillus kisonensis F0435]KRL23536.1 hypothetical protein FC98_GL000264 [Lentilactobacillus kisonensis DSM 19906 = JCM 15041]